mmetsp:Transcript_26572/g.32219  ORF Transcript_26572/g.32219 Transcript_26572/m.32219 type:complete len:115 (-) Transcript_26572:463-807(-)
MKYSETPPRHQDLYTDPLLHQTTTKRTRNNAIQSPLHEAQSSTVVHVFRITVQKLIDVTRILYQCRARHIVELLPNIHLLLVQGLTNSFSVELSCNQWTSRMKRLLLHDAAYLP